MENNKNILNLDKISKKERENVIKDVQKTLLLMEANVASPELEMLKQIGLDGHIQKAEKAKRNIQRFTVYEQRYNKNVYSGAQIKTYCEEFGYKMIRVDRFKHEIPLEVGKAIIDFNEENMMDHERSVDKIVRKSKLNLQPSNFFLLISIQAINGKPIKAATLFYREEYFHDNYDKVSEEDMLIEVTSFGKPGNDSSLMWDYITATEYLLIFPSIFMIIGIMCVVFSSNSHGMLLFLMICSLVVVLTAKKESFFKWN